MSIYVKLEQKGLFKKKLRIEDITLHKGYGTQRDYVLDEDEVDDSFLIYDNANIARGIFIDWAKATPNQMTLQLLIPTTSEEIDYFYDVIEHIASIWKCKTLMQDDTELSIQDVPVLRGKMKEFSYHHLSEFLKEYETGCYFGAMWPIWFDESDKEIMLLGGDLSGFRSYLHDKQEMDMYYPRASFYHKEDGYFGMYAITDTVNTILPRNPRVPLGYMNPDTNEELKVEKWYVSLCSISEDKILSTITYEQFKEAIHMDSLERFDAECVLLPGLTLKDLKAMVEKYGDEE